MVNRRLPFRGENIFIETGMLEMLERGILMSLQTLNHPPFLTGDAFRRRTRTRCRAKSNLSTGLQLSSEENGKYAEPGNSLMRCESSGSLLSQPNTVGVIGGVSVLSTLIFLEKLACWGSRNGRECPPFVVSSDSVLSKVLSFRGPLPSARSRIDRIKLNQDLVIENLRCKRNFLQQSGAQGLAMPCHLSHAWHSEISEDSSLPFLHVGDCVAMELKNAKLKPIHAAYTVRIGLLTTDSAFVASYYQDKLQSQGFEVVLLDKATEEHVLVPAMEALYRKDIKGARNLLRIAIHVLLVRAVNLVLLASDDLLGVLPHNDPLLRKCIDPMDALARSIIHWAETTAKRLLEKEFLNLSHAWHSEISEDSSLPFLHVGDCVAMELKNAKLKPIHAAYTVRIGLLTTDSAFVASYYQDKLQSQGFEVVLLDKATEEHVLVPAMEALYRKDIKGARNLLRIAIHVLLVRAVNLVLLASDDLLGVLPHNDPLLRKCIDPMDALARSIIHWAETTAKVHKKL